MTDHDDLDEFEMTARAAELLRAAETPAEQREALRLWLRGAGMQVDDLRSIDRSPAALLIDALNAIDAGIMPSLFAYKAKGSTLTPAKLDAQARAIAAEQVLCAMAKEKNIATVEKVRGLICSFNGLDLKSFISFADRVNAGMPFVTTGKYPKGQRYIPVIKRVSVEKARWLDEEKMFKDYGLDYNLLERIRFDLISDRSVLAT